VKVVISKEAREAPPKTLAAIATSSETAKERVRVAAEKSKEVVVRETTEKTKRKLNKEER
jgi:hypothetical protein